ncbi:MAG TPA: photosystem P840 reaction-center cytochrome c-551 [Candidatus Angelobacter sp.]|nr:photosystem P840 reaction-center cytochrome c-551 [Candidatus Angelobacter sp.]
MLSNSVSLTLGLLFILVAAANIWLALQASSQSQKKTSASRLLYLHRVGGYLFVALFCVMVYFMFGRLSETAGGASASIMVHLVLALVLVPLVFIKVLMARYYKNHYGFLLPLGLTIFVVSFVLIAVMGGPSLVRRTNVQNVSLEAIHQPSVQIDLNQASATMQQRCSRCHNLDRVISAVKDSPGWLTTVKRMQALPGSGISDDDAAVIVSYLTSQAVPSGPDPDAHMKVARALVDQRCSRCHSLDRVYKTEQSPQDWRATVTRMVSYAAGSPGSFQPGEDEQIINFLSSTQTAEAVSQRKAQVEAASSSGKSLVAAKAPAPTPAPDSPKPPRYHAPTIIFISLVGLSSLALILRRPGARTVAALRDGGAPARAGSASPSPKPPQAGNFLLHLIRITQQTPDSKTLRFAVADGAKFTARAGQFFTFSFLFNGKKVVRCYSICSSPARTGYIEITPKRVKDGSASVFLNDVASIGLTVEASGPLGQFYFDENVHKKIVLIGAGSGITPLIAMLRYIDDMGLSTRVTLLYCVRTVDDIMFRAEFEELRGKIGGFQYHVSLSQPSPDWTGWAGHISQKFIAGNLQDVQEQDFFLCGPPPFMQSTRNILIGMGVEPRRINQESFGAAVPPSSERSLPTEEKGHSVEFVRSGKSLIVRQGQSVLEAAEGSGVAIPYSCRQGQCGTCKTRVVEGTVVMDTEQGLDPSLKERGFVLLCVGHPEGPVKLDA